MKTWFKLLAAFLLIGAVVLQGAMSLSTTRTTTRPTPPTTASQFTEKCTRSCGDEVDNGYKDCYHSCEYFDPKGKPSHAKSSVSRVKVADVAAFIGNKT